MQLDDKEVFDSFALLNNVARAALVDGNTGDARNNAAGILHKALEERIALRNNYGMALEEIEKLKQK